MEFTREIYWNIGHGPSVLIPLYVFSGVALGVLLRGFWKRSLVYRLGRPVNRTNSLRLRIRGMVVKSLGQSKVLAVHGPGLAHGLFFWAMCLLLAGTCLVVLQADFFSPLLGVVFLKGSFYLWFSVILDLAGLVAIIMLAGLFVRRYLVRPRGLETGRDDAVMHGLLFLILFSGFVIEGARMSVTELGTPLAAWSPVGLVFAKVMAGSGETALRNLHTATWWFHLLAVVIFIGLIPFTKLRHIFTTSTNYLFADLGPKGSLVTFDMLDASNESYGAASITDLTWKDLFDTDACTLCKRCQDHCPAYATGKPLSPMQIVRQIGEAAFHNPRASLLETCNREALWSCTTCLACQEICPANIEHVAKIVEMRRHMVLMEGEFPGKEVVTAMAQTEVNGNPLGFGFASRGEGVQSLGIKPLSVDSDVDVLYFVGCYASFDKSNIEVSRSFVRLCQAAGIKVGILGKEEKCCGEPMRKMGNEYLYQTLANLNIKLIKGYRAKRVVTACPHCFNALNKDYRDLGFDIAVDHYTVFLDELVNSGKLRLNSQPFDCTYHDSCYLGRYNDLYQVPRNLLSIAGGNIREISRNGSASFCCGAGGGRILTEERIGERINIKRAMMAAETTAPTLITNCPFCLTMFEDGIKGAGVENCLKVRDLAVVLAERLPA